MFKESERPLPWVLDVKKELPDNEGRTVISPLHYGETIEISFIRGIEGETYINGKRFEFEEKNVFLIPPKYLHTSVYRKGGSKENDMICVLHININELSSVVNLKNLLLKDNRTLTDLAFRCDDFDALWETVQSILAPDNSFNGKIIALLRILEIIAGQKKDLEYCVEYNKTTAKLVEIIEENYSDKITVNDVARRFGYSNQYFCKWFKKETGVTFNEFFNSVRIHHAKSLLNKGCSVEETSQQCGFADPSYFTKVFKKFANISPKAYALKAKNK